jgi:ArsR family transcriptional regulator
LAEQIEQYSDIFKALSNPNRLKILLELTRCPEGGNSFATNQDQAENCQQEFAKLLGLAPSTVSHHFKELRNAGLVKVRREGKNIMVQVNTQVLNSIKTLF